MTIDVQDLSAADGYKLLTNLVTPRPIAWVTSLGPGGVINLAPFSFFNAVSSDPMYVIVSVGDENGVPKHTAANVMQTREMAVNLITEPLMDAMNVSAADFPENLSELASAGLNAAPCKIIKTPRVAEAQAALECTLHDTLRLGTNTLLIGRVVAFHVADELLGARFHITGFHPIGRLGSPSMYCRTTDNFDLPRLSYAKWQAAREHEPRPARS